MLPNIDISGTNIYEFYSLNKEIKFLTEKQEEETQKVLKDIFLDFHLYISSFFKVFLSDEEFTNISRKKEVFQYDNSFLEISGQMCYTTMPNNLKIRLKSEWPFEIILDMGIFDYGGYFESEKEERQKAESSIKITIIEKKIIRKIFKKTIKNNSINLYDASYSYSREFRARYGIDKFKVIYFNQKYNDVFQKIIDLLKFVEEFEIEKRNNKIDNIQAITELNKSFPKIIV